MIQPAARSPIVPALALFLGATPLPREQDPPPLLLEDVQVVDVAAGELRPHQSLLIQGGKIAALGPAGSLEVPEGARTVAGRGRFLIPGLFDAHVHYIDQGTFGSMLVAHGVTCVRDMGGFPSAILGLRDRLNRGRVLGPEMVAVGPIVDGDPPIWPFSRVCTTPEAGREAVRALAELGVDQIKVYHRLQREVHHAVVEEARRLGLKAVGHVPAAVTLQEALEAGQASVEHFTGFAEAFERLAGREPDPSGFGDWAALEEVDEEQLSAFVERMRGFDAVHCPTLVVMEGIGTADDPERPEDPRMQYVSPFVASFWGGDRYRQMAPWARRALKGMKTLAARLHRAGVTLMVGTDLANPYVFPGLSVHRELAFFQEVGMTPAQALRAATLVPARFLGVDDRLGTVEAGKTASLVLVRRSPLEDVRHAAEIEAVFLRGRQLDREALDGLLAQVRQSTGHGEEKEGR